MAGGGPKPGGEQPEPWVRQKQILPGDVQAIVRLLAEAVQPEKIYLLGYRGTGGTATRYLELLVVLPTRHPRSFADLEPLAAFACLGNPRVSCTLCKADHVQQMLTVGDVFYSLSCLPTHLVYTDGSPDFIPTPPEVLLKLTADALQEFNANFSRAVAFYGTAQRFWAEGNKDLVPFLLHQATELTLRAILLSLLGREKRTHSLKVLLRHTRVLAPAVQAVFPRDTDAERQLVHLLEEAYLKSRYESSFRLEDSMMEELLTRVKKLMAVAQEVFEERMLVIEGLLDINGIVP
ncbi:HEPN domain-containing protein [Rufibacter sp. LB8]|uniref:HEPN domain-containing protein n=1 Tax=Rufibacter sp. LB8 TaxID=2777781 RepID=UPI00178C3EA8|nr:HEPN domain-containing protein [Rufibacter sp. LB8]